MLQLSFCTLRDSLASDLAVLFEVLLSVQVFDALIPPLRLLFPLQEMIEELEHAIAVVLFIGQLTETMPLTHIFQHDDGFAQAPQRVKELDPLAPVHKYILVVLQNQQGCIYFGCLKYRRVSHVSLDVGPEIARHAPLLIFPDPLVRRTSHLVDQVVETGGVSGRGAGDCSLKLVRCVIRKAV